MGTFCHLKIISKLCTVTLWYYCMVGFYTLQGFQGYQVCNFWPSRLFSIDFTSSVHFLKFENQFWIRVWLNLTGADYAGDVAVPDWLVPIRYWLLIWAIGFRSEGQDEPEKIAHRREVVSGEVGTGIRRRRGSRGRRWRGKWGRSGEFSGEVVCLVGDVENFPRWGRRMTGGGDGFGHRRGPRSAAFLDEPKTSVDA
jgi:hypothetical protein